MRKRDYYRTILWLFLGVGFHAMPLAAQQVAESQEGKLWRAFLEESEARYGIQVYYPAGVVDSQTVPAHPSPISLGQLLELCAQRFDLYVTRDDGRFFLTPQPLSLEVSFQTEQPSFRQGQNSSGSRESASMVDRTVADERSEEVPQLSFGDPTTRNQAKATLSGYVNTQAGGEPIAGVSIVVPALETGTYTDAYGFFSLTIPVGEYEVIFRRVGKEDQRRMIKLYVDGNLTIELENAIRELDEVVIESDRNTNIQGTQMGIARIGIETLKQIPALMGEVDVVKAALLLPGVQTVGEGAGGFQVRGGNAGQNLILINQAPIFNSSHLFGFFSVFNADLIQRFDLYKSGVPARLGGRIASVLDIQMKDGNKQKWVGRAGISPITGRFSVEGPIVPNKSSIVLGGRGSFANWVLDLLEDPALRNSQADFYDLNGKANFQLSPKDRLDVSGYYSQDRFFLNSDTAYVYGNANAALNWKHLFNNRLFAVNSAIYSRYQYSVQSEASPSTAFDISYQIRYQELKSDWTYIPVPAHQLRFGANLIYYQLTPGMREPLGDSSFVFPEVLADEQAFEAGLYVSDEYTVNNRLTLYGGLRFSGFGMMGPYDQRNYLAGTPRLPENIVDTTQVAALGLVQAYGGPEVRLSVRYLLDEKSSVKFSYNRMRQYLHQLSNTTAISPTDTWKLSDPYIQPQIGDQLSIGYYRDGLQGGLETSVELYVKRIQHLLEYKNGAQLLLNPLVETEVIQGIGRAYGAEFLVRKTKGRLTGWVSYTYARTFIRVDGEFPDEIINFGVYYPANVDKPHDVTLVGTYKFSRRFSLASTFTYSTGRPITYPVGQYQLGTATLLNYSRRNQFRVPDYMRWDVSVFFEGNHRKNKLLHSSWAFAVYNVLGRNNVYSIFFVSEPERVQGYQLSIFARAIPTLTLNLRI